MAEESCAGCHKNIDPFGFVLESYDQIGRWRTHSPPLRTSKKYKEALGLPVESAGKLADRTKLEDITDLKKYLREDIAPFAECISEKLLTYATGRSMNCSDHKLIRDVVKDVPRGRIPRSGDSSSEFRELLDTVELFALLYFRVILRLS
tara:strand:- start:5624 stop:6070 length:447 start_codon:yes stop_codon:yes gene_type:complete